MIFDMNVAGDEVESWAAFLQRGRAALPRLAEELHRREAALGADDLATIMYTSGTTGTPRRDADARQFAEQFACVP